MDGRNCHSQYSACNASIAARCKNWTMFVHITAKNVVDGCLRQSTVHYVNVFKTSIHHKLIYTASSAYYKHMQVLTSLLFSKTFSLDNDS